jgi:hypothetical protein
MSRHRGVPLLFLAAILTAAGSAGGCGSEGTYGGATATPLPLSSCDDNLGIICVVTFGIQPPDKMLVAIHVALGGLKEIRTEIEYNGARTEYPCSSSPEFPGNFYCTGPQIPLGSRIRINVFTPATKATLASGEFTVTALAMPTVPLGTLPPPGTAYPNQ